MKVLTKFFNISTQGDTDILDITDSVQQHLLKSGLKNGLVHVSIAGSTAGITTCEYEPGLIHDLKQIFQQLIPKGKRYSHDAKWGDGNGFSHLRASLIGGSITVSFSAARLLLGTWQQIIFIDFDNRPRRREIILQFIGE